MSWRAPDYSNCCLNLISSIAGYFGCPLQHPKLPFLEEKLKGRRYQNIIVMLFDGMGMELLTRALPEDSFLRTHLGHVLSAVYPSTTTNATTAIECGLSPREAGWLGWTLYFPQIDKPVDIFTNLSNGQPAADYSVADRFLPRPMIFPRITAAGQAEACHVSRYGDIRVDTVDELFDTVLSLARDEKRRYIYTYCGDPDHTMHEEGCTAESVLAFVRNLDERVRKLAGELPGDTLLLLTADHGLVDAEFHYLEEEAPEITDMLLRSPTVEARAVAFHVKPQWLADFPAAFEHHFGGHFLLMTGEAFIRDYLGGGQTRPEVFSIVGDYMALSLDRWCIQEKRPERPLKGVHAGLTDEEMLVPLIVAKE